MYDISQKKYLGIMVRCIIIVKAFHWVSKPIKVTWSKTGPNRMITKTL